eukprot:TRINITY_DN11798_c0_g2_i4.p1 TRINITY_DN11798_c0_g2~~TRINITY_DN11798_c0_g2_i4.p1  ORF type:complete len:174 (+),score=33.62 TRINITY_DN11798_c0_g2_i4:142-663(+)
MRLPKEIWLLGDCLLRQDALTAALFTKPAMPEEIEVVLDALDTEMVLPEDINIDAVAMALYTTLESLAEPVVPFAAYQRCLDCSHNARLAKQIIIELEPVSSTTFIYVMALLKQIISNTPRAKRQDTTHPLVAMFARVLLRSPNHDTNQQPDGDAAVKANRFVASFLHLDDFA